LSFLQAQSFPVVPDQLFTGSGGPGDLNIRSSRVRSEHENNGLFLFCPSFSLAALKRLHSMLPQEIIHRSGVDNQPLSDFMGAHAIVKIRDHVKPVFVIGSVIAVVPLREEIKIKRHFKYPSFMTK